MRVFFYLFTVILSTSLAANAAVLKQDNHQRFIFSEDYSGYYVMSFTFLGMDKVRFEACEPTGHTAARCQMFAELSYTKLKNLEAPMLEMLRKYRAEVEEKKNNFWYVVSRFGLSSKDAQAIDEMIAEIEKNGLSHLVLLSDENIQKSAPKMSTPEFARELTARMKTVLESGPPMSDVDCYIELRRQGI